MRAVRLLPILLTVLVTWSCSESGAGPVLDDDGPDEYPDLSEMPVAPSVVTGPPPAVCGEPTVVGLMLGPDITTGSVTVANDEENLYVTYRSENGRPILGSALFVGDAVEEIPTTRWGTPKLRDFPYISGHGFRTFEVVWEVPLDEVAGAEAVIAAFGQIGLLPSWGAGEPITPGRSWATYFTHPVASCAAETLGPTGGSLSSPDGRAALSVPAGALSDDVVITIEPATLEELQARADEILGQGGATSAPAPSTGMAAAPATAVIPGDPPIDPASFELLELLGDRVRPLANTLWDFGPDGLEFFEPATVTLTYDDDDIPPGVSEEELGIFVINAIFTTEPAGVVDPVANTITASVDHFSFFYVGYLEVQSTDLAVTGGTAVADGIAVGSEIEYAARVANFGPADVDEVEVLYEITGDVSLGELSAGCIEVTDPAPAAVALQCAVGSIPATQGVGAPPAVFTVDGAGHVVVRVTPSFPGIDTDPINDWFEDEFRVGPLADLTVTATVSNDGEPVGAQVRFDPSVANLGPESVDGVTITYQVFGDVIPGTLDETCVEDPNPIFADLVVRCDVGAIAVDDIVQAPSAAFVAQAPGEYEVWVRPNFPGTDPVSDNDRFDYTFTATGGGTVDGIDVAVTAFDVPADPLELGEVASVQATLVNQGTDPATDVRVFYYFPASATIESTGAGCAESPSPLFGAVEAVCDVPSVAAGQSVAVPPVEVSFGSPGDAPVGVQVFQQADVDFTNNEANGDIVVAQPVADLRIDRLVDSPDPVQPGDIVTYEVDIVSAGGPTVTDGRLYLDFTGDADFVSASTNCSFGLGRYTCILDPVAPGVTQTVQLDFILTTGGETVTLDASVESLGLFDDPDPTNNGASTSTDVEAVGVTPLMVGDVVERVLPGPGSSVAYSFSGTAGQRVRIGLAILSGGNAAADLYVSGPVGPILGDEADPIRAQDFWSQNRDLVLPQDGTYLIEIEPIGSGFFRLALGTGVGRLDEAYGDPNDLQLQVYDPGRTFLTMELDNDGAVALGRETLGRVDAGGEVATSFGSGGTVDLAPILGGPAGAMAIQPDGRILVAALGGSMPYPWTVARFLPDGTLDASFGTGGVASVQVGTTNQSVQVRPLAIGFQHNGLDLDIVVAGRSASPTERIGIARLNPDGSVDTGFGTGGVVLDATFEPEYAEVQADGRILVGSAGQLRRFAADGTADAGFGSGGLVNLPAAGIRRVVALAGGDIVGVGEQGDDGLVVRLNADGSPAAFGNGGAVLMDFGLGERLFDITEDSQGRLVVVGDERTLDGHFDQLVVRMQANGQLDNAFGHGGFVVVGRDIDQGRAVGIDSQGRVLVGGEIIPGGWHFTRHLVN